MMGGLQFRGNEQSMKPAKLEENRSMHVLSNGAIKA